MSDFQASFPIATERYATGGLSYDVTIYQRGKRFHAAWYCKQCLTRAETGDWLDTGAAKRAAEAAIDTHHLHGHPALGSKG